MTKDEKREHELLLRAAFINGAEWANDRLGEKELSINLIEEAFWKWMVSLREGAK
jgi:hypothetical protein